MSQIYKTFFPQMNKEDFFKRRIHLCGPLDTPHKCCASFDSSLLLIFMPLSFRNWKVGSSNPQEPYLIGLRYLKLPRGT